MSTSTVDAHAFLTPTIIDIDTAKPKQKKKRHPKPAHMQGATTIVTGDFLGIPGLQTTAPPEVGDFSILVRAVQLAPDSCPYCACATIQFQASNGTRTKQKQRLLDEPRGFRRVLIELTRRNFRCEACKRSGLLPLWGVGEGQHLTERLTCYVEHASLLRPHAQVAMMTGLSSRKVRQVFDSYVRRLEKTVVFEPPRVIGIDGITLRKKGRFVVVTDLERKLVLYVWKYSRGKAKKDAQAKQDDQAATRALVAMLKKIVGAEQVETVVIDMSRQFRSAVEQALPDARIVIDRFHIERTANEAVDNVRRRLHTELKELDKTAKMCHAAMLRKRWHELKKHQRQYLMTWFTRHPILQKAYNAKEEFCRMWKSGSGAAAKQCYEEWARQFARTTRETREQREMRKDFRVIRTAMRGWGQYIYNYFDLDHKHTNAFTEWTNRCIRDIRRESRGCSVAVMRAKVIFGTWLRRRLEEGSQTWGEKTVTAKRTRRASVVVPKTCGGTKRSKQTQMPVPSHRIVTGQFSLFKW